MPLVVVRDGLGVGMELDDEGLEVLRLKQREKGEEEAEEEEREGTERLHWVVVV